MRTPYIAASMSLALIVAAVGAAASPSASAADAGAAIETVQSVCTSGSFIPPPRLSIWKLTCVAIFRNRSDRPVYDIEIDMHVGGLFRGNASGTRTALRAGESALLWMYWAIEDDITRDAPVTFSYRASSTGDAAALDLPRPQLQYVDRVDVDDRVVFVGEVRNADARTWGPALDDSGEQFTPLVALFRHGQLIGAGYVSDRVPSGRVGPDGRYLFVMDEFDFVANDLYRGIPRGADAIQLFFLDAFDRDASRFTAANWQLTGLDHQIETDALGKRRMTFNVSMRNPTTMSTHGYVGVIARRADFHAIGYGSCGAAQSLAPGDEGSCTGEIELIREDASLDDVRFVTVELGGAVAIVPTPTPTVTVTPCPALATPAPVPTLSSVARTLFFPWSIRMLAERCP